MILDKGNALSIVQTYHLHRPEGFIVINVHELILGSEDKFIAVPVQALGITTKNQEFHVRGETKDEALEKLIVLIKDLSHEEIFPKD